MKNLGPVLIIMMTLPTVYLRVANERINYLVVKLNAAAASGENLPSHRQDFEKHSEAAGILLERMNIVLDICALVLFFCSILMYRFSLGGKFVHATSVVVAILGLLACYIQRIM